MSGKSQAERYRQSIANLPREYRKLWLWNLKEGFLIPFREPTDLMEGVIFPSHLRYRLFLAEINQKNLTAEDEDRIYAIASAEMEELYRRHKRQHLVMFGIRMLGLMAFVTCVSALAGLLVSLMYTVIA